MDHLTKYPFAQPLKRKGAIDVLGALEKMFLLFGTPRTIISDNGGEFVNGTIGKLFSDNDVEHRTTAAYHPQANGLTERMNNTIKSSLVKTSDPAEAWPEFLDQVLLGIRQHKCRATNKDSIEVMIGKKLASLSSEPCSDKDCEKFLENFDLEGETFLLEREKVRENILSEQDKQKKSFDSKQKKNMPEIKVGDEVFIENSKKRKMKGASSVSKLIGPFQVKELSTSTVSVEVEGKDKKVNRIFVFPKK